MHSRSGNRITSSQERYKLIKDDRHKRVVMRVKLASTRSVHSYVKDELRKQPGDFRTKELRVVID